MRNLQIWRFSQLPTQILIEKVLEDNDNGAKSMIIKIVGELNNMSQLLLICVRPEWRKLSVILL